MGILFSLFVFDKREGRAVAKRQAKERVPGPAASSDIGTQLCGVFALWSEAGCSYYWVFDSGLQLSSRSCTAEIALRVCIRVPHTTLQSKQETSSAPKIRIVKIKKK